MIPFISLAPGAVALLGVWFLRDSLGGIPGALPFAWIGVGALWWFGMVDVVEQTDATGDQR